MNVLQVPSMAIVYFYTYFLPAVGCVVPWVSACLPQLPGFFPGAPSFSGNLAALIYTVHTFRFTRDFPRTAIKIWGGGGEGTRDNTYTDT